VCLSYPRR